MNKLVCSFHATFWVGKIFQYHEHIRSFLHTIYISQILCQVLVEIHYFSKKIVFLYYVEYVRLPFNSSKSLNKLKNIFKIKKQSANVPLCDADM